MISVFKKCDASYLERIDEFYRYACKNTADMNLYGKWIYGLHPTKNQIETYIKNGYMYCLETNGKILGAVAVTPFQEKEYESIKWQIDCPDDEVSTVHLLAVNPDYQKSGIAKQIMLNIAEIAKNNKSKALRLDVLSCNTPAQKLYQSAGFKKMGVCNWFAENVGDTDFYLYELLLK